MEFEIDTLKRLGALPVFYIPKATNDEQDARSLGSTLVLQAIDAMILAMRIAEIPKYLPLSTSQGVRQNFTFGFRETGFKTFSLDVTETRRVLDAVTHAITPPDMLRNGIEGLLNFFYPADDILHDKMLDYYRQREWRIVGNFAVKGEEVMGRPSEALKDQILKIDTEFFGREIDTPQGKKRRMDEVYIFSGIGDRRLIEDARRVIVPADAVGRARAILSSLAHPPVVAEIEELD